ncbi:uncharacterized protein EV422DRAFT_180576 [Fimicolochytrium jonesii]|uniref:uncharacterized protein n=1 Tax=Fimicolochytrium jonesii TaxID=1396493 RepID=UPI0022FEAE76|nr:uncharacterized protein EV422DRAFT_180576 [Fimicolochytrium jonesii]KAI8818333.1 hypothetical protein EV422DRAFT_180576 [Fimicolochytrium jonesii]
MYGSSPHPFQINQPAYAYGANATPGSLNPQRQTFPQQQLQAQQQQQQNLQQSIYQRQSQFPQQNLGGAGYFNSPALGAQNAPSPAYHTPYESLSPRQSTYLGAIPPYRPDNGIPAQSPYQQQQQQQQQNGTRPTSAQGFTPGSPTQRHASMFMNGLQNGGGGGNSGGSGGGGASAATSPQKEGQPTEDQFVPSFLTDALLGGRRNAGRSSPKQSPGAIPHSPTSPHSPSARRRRSTSSMNSSGSGVKRGSSLYGDEYSGYGSSPSSVRSHRNGGSVDDDLPPVMSLFADGDHFELGPGDFGSYGYGAGGGDGYGSYGAESAGRSPSHRRTSVTSVNSETGSVGTAAGGRSPLRHSPASVNTANGSTTTASSAPETPSPSPPNLTVTISGPDETARDRLIDDISKKAKITYQKKGKNWVVLRFAELQSVREALILDGRLWQGYLLTVKSGDTTLAPAAHVATPSAPSTPTRAPISPIDIPRRGRQLSGLGLTSSPSPSGRSSETGGYFPANGAGKNSEESRTAEGGKAETKPTNPASNPFAPPSSSSAKPTNGEASASSSSATAHRNGENKNTTKNEKNAPSPPATNKRPRTDPDDDDDAGSGTLFPPTHARRTDTADLGTMKGAKTLWTKSGGAKKASGYLGGDDEAAGKWLGMGVGEKGPLSFGSGFGGGWWRIENGGGSRRIAQSSSPGYGGSL